jgi:hypothetical protein
MSTIEKLKQLHQAATAEIELKPSRHATHSDLEGKVFPLPLYDLNYIWDEDEIHLTRIDIVERRVIAYNLADGATKKTVLIREPNGQRFRSSVEMHFPTREDARSAAADVMAHEIQRCAREDLATLAVEALPDLLEAVDALEYLVAHVMHTGSMLHAHPDAFRDAANARAILNKLQGI